MSEDRGKLRGRAEEQLAAEEAEEPRAEPDHELRRLVHELKVHEIELELQNEELRAARLELEVGLRRYTELFDFAPIGYFVLDPDGTIHDLNLAGARLLGGDRRHLEGRRIAQFIQSSQRTGFQEFLERALERPARDPGAESCELTLAGDESREVRLTGAAIEVGPPTVLMAMEDVTARKRAEAALLAEHQERERRLSETRRDLRAMRRLHRISTLALPEESDRDAVLVEIVGTAIAIVGSQFASLELVDQSDVLEIVAQLGLPEWWLQGGVRDGASQAAFRLEERVILENIEDQAIQPGTLDLEIYRRAGVRALVSTPLCTRAGTLLGTLTTYFEAPHPAEERELNLLDLLARQAADLIEQAREERERAEMARELVETMRFAEQFIGVLGHDLRNPLSAIRMAAGFLKSQHPEIPERKTLDRILLSTQRMGNMVAQLLDLTRARLAGGIVVERHAGDLTEVVRGVLEELALAHPTREIRSSLPPRVPGEWDSTRLAQVFSNLVGNALEYGAPERAIEVRLDVLDSAARLEVQSFGPPIPPELLPTIFDAYRRGGARAEKTGGLGLGLFISKQIVLAHGGRLEVRSTNEQGTTFAVILPVEPSTAARAG